MTFRQWLLLCVPAFFWGSAFVFMEIALPTFSPILIVMGRMLIAAIALNIVRYLTEQNQKQRSHFSIYTAPLSLWLQCAGLSLTSTLLPFGLVVWGQQYITASLASILISIAPVFTVVLATVLLKEKLTPSRMLGVALGFGGVVTLVGPTVLGGFSLSGLGELSIIGAALSYSIAGFWGNRFRAIPPQAITTMTVTMGAVIILPLGLFFQRPFTVDWSLSPVLAVVGLGVLSTAIAYIAYFHLLSQVGVVNTSLVSFVVPLSTLLLSAIFLKEQLSLGAIAGMTLILTGLAVLDGRLFKSLSKR